MAVAAVVATIWCWGRRQQPYVHAIGIGLLLAALAAATCLRLAVSG